MSEQINVQLTSKSKRQPVKPLIADPKRDIEFLRDKDRELVKGIFHFYEQPGGVLEFPYRKWKGDDIENHTFYDGQVHTVPLGVARHLNNSGEYWVFEHHQSTNEFKGAINPYDKNGMRIAKKKKRYGFQSLEFMEVEDIGTAQKVVNIEYTPNDF